MTPVIGIDLVSVKKVKTLWKKNHKQVEETILSSKELSELQEEPNTNKHKLNLARVHYLATRFAAKEAVIKALALNDRVDYELSDIQILGQKKLKVCLKGALLTYAQKKGIEKWFASSSPSGGLAFAVVIGEKKNE